MIRAKPTWVNGCPVIELDYDGDERGHANIRQHLSPEQTERLVGALLRALNDGRAIPDWASGKMSKGYKELLKSGGRRS